MRHLTPGPGNGGSRTLTLAARVTLVLGPLLCGAACGLINSDIATITFPLPSRTYSFDTSQAGWNGGTSGAFATVPPIACTADADCCPPLITAAGIDCSMLICDAPTQTCAFAVVVETPPQMINLKNEAPQLKPYSSQSILDISVSSITYTIPQNTLNVNLPPVELFVAPQGTTTASDPAAIRFGKVPVIAAGSTVPGKVDLDPAGKAAFENIAKNFGTPFVFLSRARVVVPGGTPAPTGALTLTISGTLSVKPNL